MLSVTTMQVMTRIKFCKELKKSVADPDQIDCDPRKHDQAGIDCVGIIAYPPIQHLGLGGTP